MGKAFVPTLAINATPELLGFDRGQEWLGSYKYDGVRAYVRKARLMSRSAKRIVNRYTQELFGCKALEGLDGELIVGEPFGKGLFQRTMSGITSELGRPDVKFYVFDWIDAPEEFGYEDRLGTISIPSAFRPYVQVVPHRMIRTQKQLDKFLAEAMREGYEGVMLRRPDAPYHIDRCGVTTPYLLRVKPKVRCEVKITGIEPLQRNNNEAFADELGRTKRSSAKAGRKVDATMLGKFVTEWRDDKGKAWPLKVGTGQGMTAEFRKYVMQHPDEFIGGWLTIEYQEVGMKNVPRSPSAIGMRWKGDMIDLEESIT